jgi:hypothetical protein
MPSSTLRPAWHSVRRISALWIGVLAGPLVWLALLETNYVLSYVSCETRHTWFLHVAALAAFVLVAAAGAMAWASGPPGDSQERTPPVTRSTAEVRARWMSLVGVGISLWFLLVILAMEIPALVVPPCEGR